jgi:hypothetical protein
MTSQTNHLKLPRLSFLSTLCGLSVRNPRDYGIKNRNEPNRPPLACRSGLRAGIQRLFCKTNPNIFSEASVSSVARNHKIERSEIRRSEGGRTQFLLLTLVSRLWTQKNETNPNILIFNQKSRFA